MNKGQPVELLNTKYGWMFAPPGDQYVTGSLRNWGVYSETETLILNRLCQNATSVLNAGGNIGALILGVANNNTSAQFHVFEPQPLLFKMLKANIAINNLDEYIHVYQGILSDNTDDVYIPMIKTDCEYNMGRFGKEDWEKPESLTYGIKTKSYEINRVLEFNQVDFIILDVEGMELDLLRKAEDYIKTYMPTMWIECDREDNGKEMIQYIYDLGYSPYWMVNPLTPDGARPDISPWPMQCSFNLLCVPEGELFPLPNIPQIKASPNDPIGNAPADKIIYHVKDKI